MSSTQFQQLNTIIPPFAAPKDFTETYNTGLRVSETTKRYILGTRHLTWDGRVFKYSLSSGVCCSGAGVKCSQAPFVVDAGAVHPAVATVAGDTSYQIASQTVAENALAGGYTILYTTDADKTQFRGIVGNTKGAASTITLYLDEPLTEVTTTATDIVVYYSPYYGLAHGSAFAGSEYASVLGIPAAYVAATGYYFWTQTWGPCRCTAGEAGYGNAVNERQMIFDADGSLWKAGSTGGSCNASCQYAGFIIPYTSGQDDAPLLMLQISI